VTGFLKPSGANAGVFFVSADKVLFRTVATDRPAKDANGSGIVKAFITCVDDNGSTSSTRTTTAATAGENPATEPGNRYVWSGEGANGADGAAAISANGFALTSGHKYAISTTFVDAVGNKASTAKPIFVALDNDKPTSANAVSMDGSEIAHDAKRYGKTPAFSFNPTDGANGSGIKAWVVNASPANPRRPIPVDHVHRRFGSRDGDGAIRRAPVAERGGQGVSARHRLRV
jgi:hypothetical protein